MKNKRYFSSHLVVLFVSLFLMQGCQTLKEIANLRNVNFALGAVSNINLAGINLDNIRSFGDVKATDVVKLTAALLKNELPLSFVVDLKAENPSDNQIAARLTRMDWTLFLDEQETISGALEKEYVLNPGQPERIPVDISLDLADHFDRPLRDMIELASAIKGDNGASKTVKLVATPIIDTILGPIRYPEPITVVNETIGG